MLVSVDGTVQPVVGQQAHWVMFDEVSRHPDLFGPLHDEVIREVDAIVANGPAHDTKIDSARLAKNVLETIGSWWHGEFPRRFPGFPNGAARGLVGMTLWHHLAGRRQDWWSFTEVKDRHGFGQNHMLYVRLQQGDPLIPTDSVLTLFHGTSHLLAEQIAREGLQPGRGTSNNWNPDWHSRENLVYLTDHWAAYYGGRIDAKLCAEQKASECAVILRISIDSRNVALFPDEDYIHHRLHKPRTEAESRILKESPEFAVSPKGIDPTEPRWHEIGITWEDSLQEEGTVATYRVEPSAIIGYHTIKSVEEAGVLGRVSGDSFGFLNPAPLRVCPYGQLLKTELLNRTYAPLTVEAARVLKNG